MIFTTTAVLLILPGLISLGNWQMHRFHTKNNLAHNIQNSHHSTAQPLTEYIKNNQNISEWHKVILPATVDRHHIFLLDHKWHQHQHGYAVLTPVTTPLNSVILVNWGWISSEKVNQQPTEIATMLPTNPTIIGYIRYPHNQLLLNTKQNLGPGWPKTMQVLQIKEIAKILKKPISEFYIQTTKPPQGLLKLNQTNGMSPERHRAYAWQWWMMALVLLLLYIGLNLTKED